ncbi:MAG TPA: 50S ribosomal protein L25 [Chloroflexota bacterium]|nr:50S ribosomal protein L25 [Chloroflexota bacterium]
MATHVRLEAERREMLGKKVRRLRGEGKTPATVYGHQMEPVSIQIDSHSLRAALRHSGRTQLIDLVIGGAQPNPVFVRQTAVDPKRNQLLHVEFYHPNLRQRATSRVPLHMVGESQAVKDGGILLTVLDHVDIESLPDDVPAGGLDVNLEQIAEINGAIHAGDLQLPPSVTLVTPPDEVLVRVNPPVSEEAVEEMIAETEPLPAELGGDATPPDAVPEA